MKVKRDDWFETWFNTQDYLELYKHRDNNDAGKVVSLLFKHIKINKSAKVLDLCCGNGRHSVLFSKKGFDTLGIDLSPYLIKEAKKLNKACKSEISGKLRFERKDMRKISHKNEFDLVVNLFTSFGYFEKERENEKVIQSVSNALKKDGYFFFDFLNANYLENNIIPFSLTLNKGKALVQLRQIKKRIIEKTILIFDLPRKSIISSNCRIYTEKIRLFSDIEFKRIFRKFKLNIIKIFGDYNGNSFNRTKSERLIILAQKL